MPKANPGILKRVGEIKMWIWLCIEGDIYLGPGMKEIVRNIVRQKKMLTE